MAEAKRIDGKGFAEGLRDKVAEQVRTLKEMHGLTPGLAVVLVGTDPASEIYVRNKHK
ncbi:MAG: bifunctional methylenetetrahydrofolate dehydrogenase/methenyltetrahydrofolate cyclohydrolase, partial [Rhodospirillaceae bacterium]|nr:bifunctional methylenetetrahydrofolate dehydrogenase/methenyltetrahydrofolate cyclohydrolase [Rhodospirillaceae bacterium]